MAVKKGSKKYPGVFPRGSGYAGAVKVRGKTHWTVIFPTQKEAYDARRPLKEAIEGINARNSSVAPYTVGAFREWWFAQERANTKIQRERGTANKALKRKTLNSYEEQTKEFAEVHKDRLLTSFQKSEALTWIMWPENDSRDRRWQHGGIRRMFTAATHHDIRPDNPFTDLRLSGSNGRKRLDPIIKGVDKVPHIWRLADCAIEVRSDRVGQEWRAIILLLAFVGLRPGELYGLERGDFDFKNGRLHIAASTRMACGATTTTRRTRRRTGSPVRSPSRRG